MTLHATLHATTAFAALSLTCILPAAAQTAASSLSNSAVFGFEPLTATAGNMVDNLPRGQNVPMDLLDLRASVSMHTGLGKVSGATTQATANGVVPTVNVLDPRFGAKCNYENDDTVAIQAALDTTSPIWGGDVFLPQGCLITSSLHLRHPHTHIHGAGHSIITLITNNADFNVFELENSFESIDDIWISQYGHPKDGQFWAVHDNTVGGSYDFTSHDVDVSGGHSGFYLKGGRVSLWRPKFTQIAAGTGVGIQFDSAGGAEIRDVFAPYMENSPGQDAMAGILVTGGSDVNIHGPQIEKMGSPLLVRPAANASVASVYVDGGYFDTSAGPEAFLDGSAFGSAIVGVQFTGVWMSSGATGLKIVGNVTGVHVANSEIFGNIGNGIDTTQANSCEGLTVTGTLISGNGEAGIAIGKYQLQATIVGNTIGPTGQFGANKYGISILSGNSDYLSIVGNNVSGNSILPIKNNSLGFHNIVIGNNDGRHLGQGATSFQQDGVTSTSDAQGSEAFIGSGNGNYVFGAQGAIGSGYVNKVNGSLGFIGSGQLNVLNGKASGVIAGQFAYDHGNDGTWVQSQYGFGNAPGTSQSTWHQFSGSIAAANAPTRLTVDGDVPQSGKGVNNSLTIQAGAVFKIETNLSCSDIMNGDFATWRTKQGTLDHKGANARYTGDATNGSMSDLAALGAGASAVMTITPDTTLQGLALSVAWPNADVVHCTASVHATEVQ